MKITGNQARIGNILEYKGRLWRVAKTQHVKPGKGGAFVQMELKDIRDGTKLNERFRATETLTRARLEQTTCQFLFQVGTIYTFMDCNTFEQVEVDQNIFEQQQLPFLIEGIIVVIETFEGTPISVALPEHVICQVVEADAVVKGQTASSSYKPAFLDNGLKVLVPPYIDVGMTIKINTSDASFVERVKV